MIKFLALIPVVVFLWEHIGSIYHSDTIPSFIIGNATEPFQNISVAVGGYVARVSSYLYHMQLKEMARSAWNLFSKTFLFLLSPVWSIKGYVETAYHEYGSPYVIYIGTIILFLAVAGLLYHYRSKLPFDTTRVSNFLTQNGEKVFLSLAIITGVLCFYYAECIYPYLTIWNTTTVK